MSRALTIHRRRALTLSPARVPGMLLGVFTMMTLSGCDGSGDMLPGRSRPVFKHDWPHPRDMRLEPAAFTPPNPGEARFQATTGAGGYIVPGPDDPLVRLTAAIPLGRLHERPGEAGASELLARLLVTRGPSGGRALSLRLAELGTTLELEQTLDLTRISLDVLPEDWRAGLELLIDLLRRPDVSPSAIQQYRAGSGYDMPMAGIAGEGFRPKVELERLILGYPLAPLAPGTTVSVNAVQDLAQRTLAGDNVVLGIGGNVDRAAVITAVEAATRGWPVSKGTLPPPRVFEPRPRDRAFHTVDVPSLEGWIAIGKAVGTVPDSDRAALAVTGFILSERLNIAAREIRGLANRDAFFLPETASGTGLLHIRTGGRPEAVGPLVRFSLDQVQRMHDPQETVTDEELTRAKGWLVHAEWRGRLEGATSAATAFALEDLRREGTTDHLMAWPQAVEAVTAQQVKTMAQRYLDPATLTTVVAGPLTQIRAARHPRWPVAWEELETR